MSLTIYYDGQFWVGVIEVSEDGKLKAYRYVFGTEPKDIEVLHFIYFKLTTIISNSSQNGVCEKRKSAKKVNPKRLQRQVAQEMKNTGISSKAQEALKQELEEKKLKKKITSKQAREEMKQQKYLNRKKKAKEKHRGK